MWKWSRTLLVIGSAVVLFLRFVSALAPSLGAGGLLEEISRTGDSLWGVRRLRRIKHAQFADR